MKEARTLALSVTLFRGLLGLYPSSFRRRFGPEMTLVFQDSARAALTNGGSRMVAVLWISAFWDLITTAFVERITEEYHMSVSSAGRVAGLLGAIGGAIWIVGSLAQVMGSDLGGPWEWVPAAAAAMMAIGVIGLYLRSGFNATGVLSIAFLFLSYLLMTVGLGLLALSADDSGNVWAIWIVGLVLALVAAVVFGLYASRQRWGLPWTPIMAVIGVLNLVITLPLALGLGGEGASPQPVLESVLEFAFFGSIGLYALIVGLLAMTGEAQEAPPVLPAV